MLTPSPNGARWLEPEPLADPGRFKVTYTAFAHTKDRTTARLVVRRVKDARYPDALFPIWRYHPFFTNSTLPTAQADITHRRHATIETVFADLIDGPLAHLPSRHSLGMTALTRECALLHEPGASTVARGLTPAGVAVAHNVILAEIIFMSSRHADPNRAITPGDSAVTQ
jgi:hypothetical protein